MYDERQLTGAEQELARQLGRLSPARHYLNRDSLMFHAGQAFARRQTRPWRLGATGLALLAAGLGLRLATPPAEAPAGAVQVTAKARAADPRVEERRRHGWVAPPRAGDDLQPASDYLVLRNRLVVEGIEALPAAEWVIRPADTVESAASWWRGSTTLDVRSGNLDGLNLPSPGDRS